jgi:hypothetical protein
MADHPVLTLIERGPLGSLLLGPSDLQLLGSLLLGRFNLWLLRSVLLAHIYSLLAAGPAPPPVDWSNSESFKALTKASCHYREAKMPCKQKQ